jgi:hypothetical protein
MERPQQFLKRQTSINTSTFIEVPFLELSELSEKEKPDYESWWKDLDPFNLLKINNQTVLKFLNTCSLEQQKLEQVNNFLKQILAEY